LSHFRAWLRTSNVAASGFGFGRDCNGFTDYRHFNQNPCNSILSLYLSAFHFFVVTLRNYFLTNNEHKKTTLTLQSGGQNAVSIEKNTAHSRNPLLDQLEIIAEAIGGLLEGKSSFSQSELRSLAHIRQMTRMHKTKSGE